MRNNVTTFLLCMLCAGYVGQVMITAKLAEKVKYLERQHYAKD